MPLFEVAIIEEPTKKEREEGTAEERLVFGPTPVIAQDAQTAGIRAVMDSKDGIKVDRNRMRVLVRPFA